ncbi:hypothetical protein PAXRUDRAFT_745258 [Paxillus rubicundulus Ve08.2h10]|uniref:Uncharacterized protein n=1 Tax=Paxillus rubicundulus Ve08.2h10 TaxID=930991 RepID=A0A0D0DC49_9AGAM|nr:hypothetical protein PAXRUDRAFT_745258 [Paxillus rubicundulus Ve08.2h10]
MTHELVLQSMNTWRKFRTYGDVRSQTLSTLYWDGIMYMFWIILLTTANMVMVITAPMPYIPSFDTWQSIASSPLGSFSTLENVMSAYATAAPTLTYPWGLLNITSNLLAQTTDKWKLRRCEAGSRDLGVFCLSSSCSNTNIYRTLHDIDDINLAYNFIDTSERCPSGHTPSTS